MGVLFVVARHRDLLASGEIGEPVPVRFREGEVEDTCVALFRFRERGVGPRSGEKPPLSSSSRSHVKEVSSTS